MYTGHAIDIVGCITIGNITKGDITIGLTLCVSYIGRKSL